MSLAALIRGKATVAGKVATATPATFATDRGGTGPTVATVATVTVATQSKPNTHPIHLSLVPMLTEEEKAVRDWLAQINETDPATIADVIQHCQKDSEARTYFTGRAEAELPEPIPFPDNRRTCSQCLNLSGCKCLTTGPQQINNGALEPSRTREIQTKPNQLSEGNHELLPNTRTPGYASRTDTALETVGEIDGAKNT